MFAIFCGLSTSYTWIELDANSPYVPYLFACRLQFDAVEMTLQVLKHLTSGALSKLPQLCQITALLVDLVDRN